MTCVLSMPTLYTFDDGYNYQEKSCFDESDNPWNSGDRIESKINECSKYCRSEICTGLIRDSSKTNIALHKEITTYHATNQLAKTENLSEEVSTDRGCDGTVLCCSDMQADNNNMNDVTRGIKRKIDPEEFVPTKKISPFLNTPRQKKVEKKKILKLSVKKLKDIEDPEIFLRRAVLVNNTMKRLQLELREDKKRKRRLGYRTGRTSNNVHDTVSSSYFDDDNFLNAVQEKVTDDMTDIPVHNVLNDESDDNAHTSRVKFCGINEIANENEQQFTTTGDCRNEVSLTKCNLENKRDVYVNNSFCNGLPTRCTIPRSDSTHAVQNNISDSCESMDVRLYVQLLQKDNSRETVLMTF